MTVRRLAALVAALVLLPAAAAQARPPVLISTSGEAVGIAVDAAGTAHIAFNATNYPSEQGEPLMYCAWPAHANGCTPQPLLIDGQNPAAQPPLIATSVPPGQLAIVSSRDTIDVIRSADNGATWSAPAPIGTGRWFGGSIGPNGQLALSFRDVDYIEFYERSLLGSAADTATADLNHGYGVESVTGFAGGIPVLVSQGETGMAVSSWSGLGDIHDPATWLGPYKIARPYGFDLASGPRGLWLVYAVITSSADYKIYARRFNAATHRFGPRHRIPGVSPINGLGLDQSTKGRMVVAWYDDVRDRIMASASKTGAHWTRAKVLATGVSLPANVRVGLGPNGRGLVVWDDNGDNKIKGVRVDASQMLKKKKKHR
jgi:hypothetical protein